MPRPAADADAAGPHPPADAAGPHPPAAACSAAAASQDTSKTDGAPKFSNDEGMSVYRHSGYWYIGDLGPWPPETHYRCIQGCEHGMDSPQLDKVYEQNRNIGQLPAPTLQADPCAVNDEL